MKTSTKKSFSFAADGCIFFKCSFFSFISWPYIISGRLPSPDGFEERFIMSSASVCQLRFKLCPTVVLLLLFFTVKSVRFLYYFF